LLFSLTWLMGYANYPNSVIKLGAMSLKPNRHVIGQSALLKKMAAFWNFSLKISWVSIISVFTVRDKELDATYN